MHEVHEDHVCPMQASFFLLLLFLLLLLLLALYSYVWARSLVCFAGAAMLLAYKTNYKQHLEVAACNSFIHRCISHSAEAGGRGTRAVILLLEGMQHPLPSPNLETFCAMTECIITQLNHDVPSYHLVTQLYQHVLLRLQEQLGCGSELCRCTRLPWVPSPGLTVQKGSSMRLA